MDGSSSAGKDSAIPFTHTSLPPARNTGGRSSSRNGCGATGGTQVLFLMLSPTSKSARSRVMNLPFSSSCEVNLRAVMRTSHASWMCFRASSLFVAIWSCNSCFCIESEYEPLSRSTFDIKLPCQSHILWRQFSELLAARFDPPWRSRTQICS